MAIKIRQSNGRRSSPGNGFYLAISACSVIAVLLLWWIASRHAWVNPLFLPSPSEVWSAFADIVHEGYKGSTACPYRRKLPADFPRLDPGLPYSGAAWDCLREKSSAPRHLRSVHRVLPAASAACLLLAAGALVRDSGHVQNCSAVPRRFAPMFIAAVYSTRRIPVDRINGARSLGANGLRLYLFVIFLPVCRSVNRPADGGRSNLRHPRGGGMVAAVSGIGWMVLDASKYLRSDIIYAVIIIMGIIAILIDLAIRLLIRRVSPWIEQ